MWWIVQTISSTQARKRDALCIADAGSDQTFFYSFLQNLKKYHEIITILDGHTLKEQISSQVATNQFDIPVELSNLARESTALVSGVFMLQKSTLFMRETCRLSIKKT